MNILKSIENIEHIRSQLVPIITKSWYEEEPYKHLKDFNNIYLNENNPIVKKCKDELYNIFLHRISKTFKQYTIYENNVNTVYSYVSDRNFNNANWHNHNNTGSISGVFYMKCVKDKGIKFRDKGIEQYIEPKENELVIFPGDLLHYPIPSKNDELRISCNMNLMCSEKINDLFDPKNIRENFSK
tara:strand:+ start:213 stop:767 length:555 start_codon:yes stop_codon:yes gene_type:complete